MIDILKEECCGCGACITACPQKCIQMEEDEEGFRYPIIEKNKCINCGLCNKSCPYLNTEERGVENPVAMGIVNLNEEKSKYSSSGGFFPAIAEYIISKGGTVYGAVLTNDCHSVNHIRVNSVYGLKDLYGSKYLQSDTKNSYFKVKNDLDDGLYVLFSGTPCQIAGLKTYLRKEYSKLICVEVVCHGVPSSSVWRKYLDYIENKVGPRISKVVFRDQKMKKNGGVLIMYIENDKGHSYRAPSWQDPFYKLFLENKILRPHCYRCKYKKTHYLADFTIADFWGIQNIAPNFGEEGKVSLVILNNEKAKRIFEDIKENLQFIETDIDKALMSNPPYNESVNKSDDRDRFFKDNIQMSFAALKKKYSRLSLKERVKVLLMRCGLY